MRSVHANMPSCLFATGSIAVLHTLSLTYQSSPSCHVVSLGLPKNGCIQLSSTTFNVSRCHGQYSLSTLPALPAAVSLRTSCHQWTSHLSTLRSTHTHTSAWYACIFSVYRIVSLRCAPCMLSRIRIQFASYFVFWEFLFMKGAPCVRLLSCSIVIVVILLFFFALTLFDVEFSASILHWIWIKKAALTGLRARSPAQHWAILLWMSYGLLAFSTHRTAYTAFHTIILLAPCSPPPFIVECKAMFNMAMTSAPWPCMCVRTPIHYAKCRIIRFGLLLHIWEMKKKKHKIHLRQYHVFFQLGDPERWQKPARYYNRHIATVHVKYFQIYSHRSIYPYYAVGRRRHGADVRAEHFGYYCGCPPGGPHRTRYTMHYIHDVGYKLTPTD